MKNQVLFPLAIGISDGIVTALILSSGGILSNSITFMVAVRISFGSAFAGMFSFFIAQFAGLNEELRRTAFQLNIRKVGYLMKGKLGRDIFYESVQGTLIAFACSFLGALVPLSSSIIFGSIVWVPFLVSYIFLSILGLFISRTTKSSPIMWSAIMVGIGLAVTFAGYYLKIVV
ncbi:MAG: hypothetical protein ACP5UV_04140 [Thermoplasmata archaeon]